MNIKNYKKGKSSPFYSFFINFLGGVQAPYLTKPNECNTKNKECKIYVL